MQKILSAKKFRLSKILLAEIFCTSEFCPRFSSVRFFDNDELFEKILSGRSLYESSPSHVGVKVNPEIQLRWVPSWTT